VSPLEDLKRAIIGCGEKRGKICGIVNEVRKERGWRQESEGKSSVKTRAIPRKKGGGRSRGDRLKARSFPNNKEKIET